MRTTWREFVENSPHEFIFLHSEELDNFGLSDFQDKLPICLEKVDDIKDDTRAITETLIDMNNK